MDALLKKLPVLTCIAGPKPITAFTKEALIKHGIEKLDYNIALVTQAQRSIKSLNNAIAHFESKNIDCENLYQTKRDFGNAYIFLVEKNVRLSDVMPVLRSLIFSQDKKLEVDEKCLEIEKICTDIVKQLSLRP